MEPGLLLIAYMNISRFRTIIWLVVPLREKTKDEDNVDTANKSGPKEGELYQQGLSKLYQ